MLGEVPCFRSPPSDTPVMFGSVLPRTVGSDGTGCGLPSVNSQFIGVFSNSTSFALMVLKSLLPVNGVLLERIPLGDG